MREAVFVQLTSKDLYKHKVNGNYDREDFYAHPEDYESKFLAYTKVTDLMINGMYWEDRIPRFFSKEDMQSRDFKIRVIADISCDINGSVPATMKIMRKEEPVYGYDPLTQQIVEPSRALGTIDIMTVDNLPSQLPKDASEHFGKQFIDKVLNELFKKNSSIIEAATIVKRGKLTPPFEYLGLVAK